VQSFEEEHGAENEDEKNSPNSNIIGIEGFI
jgi:hypothetical protein